MSDNVIPFLFEGENLVRVISRGDDPWFVAADVCKDARYPQCGAGAPGARRR